MGGVVFVIVLAVSSIVFVEVEENGEFLMSAVEPRVAFEVVLLMFSMVCVGVK